MSKLQLLAMMDAVSHEKGISREDVIEALEGALAATVRRREGDSQADVTVVIDPDTGEPTATRHYQVVEEVLNNAREVEFGSQRAQDQPIGTRLDVALEPPELTRVAAQTAKQVIVQRLRDALRERVVEEWRDEVGQLVYGTVKRVDKSGVWVELAEQAEAFLPSREAIPGERWKAGQRMRALLQRADVAQKGVPLTLTRRAPDFLGELMKLEIPEIGNDQIRIRALARDPGRRAKVAVEALNGFRGDPIGTCIGMRGSRIQSVVTEMGGERVDVIEWSDNPASLIVSAFAPATIDKLVLDTDQKKAWVAVDEANLAKAIGKNGQQVKLAQQLTGWELRVVRHEELEAEQAEESARIIALFREGLGVDESFATALYEANFTDLDEIAFVPTEELLGVEGIDEDVVEELRERARGALLDRALNEASAEHRADASLLAVPGMDEDTASLLVEQGIRTAEDLADAAVGELDGFDPATLGPLIMAAREQQWNQPA